MAKVRPIAGLIWDWLTPGISYSTGSSIVRILRLGSLRIDRIVASVVVLPLPVGPVITIMPCGSFKQPPQLGLVRLREPELFHDQQAAILGQDTDDGGFAMLRRHDRDADIDVGAPGA